MIDSKKISFKYAFFPVVVITCFISYEKYIIILKLIQIQKRIKTKSRVKITMYKSYILQNYVCGYNAEEIGFTFILKSNAIYYFLVIQ